MKSNYLRNISTYTEVILDSISDGVFTVDDQWKITFFNHAAEKITGIDRQEAVGKNCSEVFKANICETECALKCTMKHGKSIINKKIFIIDTFGIKKTISISTALLKDRDGKIIGGVETFRDLSAEEQLRKELKSNYTFADIISKNHRMHQLFRILPEIAVSNSTILIEGESGTGKELFARAIHNLSKRNKKRFVAINCAALPDTLLESELFGYKAGAFTDAKKDKPGRFAQAEGGTLFLDEIGDISPALQVRLLRVLQEKVYEPLGSVHPCKADVRIIAATNKSLTDLVKKNVFREDLFYRINVIRLNLPPLRERHEDIPLIIEHFINHFNFIMDKNIADVSADVMNILMNYDFPGNIRELENAMEHAFVLCGSDIIQVEHLPEYMIQNINHNANDTDNIGSFKNLERNFLIEALRKNSWKRLATAKSLGIHKSTLFRKLKLLKIDAPKPEKNQHK